LKLVDLVDRVLEMFDADASFVFTLDGQLATVDDYVEVRPEAEPRIRELVEEGRLAIGPWQTLVDEFLVSGETIMRDLEWGTRRAEGLGGAMRVGYLPDMFGHVAQMPQLLRRAGIGTAVLWRGVPAAIDRHRFVWDAPDGSSVDVEYLPAGYGNGAHLLDAPERLVENVRALVDAMRPFFDGDPVLAMYGTDHMQPHPDLVALVEQANRSQDDFRLELVTLPAYVEAAGSQPGRRWRGELRSGARANLLMGVVSARIDLKAAAARAERWLERYAEPFAALHTDVWPERFLELAWRRVLENAAHDSICGCSVDEVSAQVLVRYAEAEQIASGLADRTAASVAQRAGATVVLNPSPFARADVVALDADGTALELPDGTRAAAQRSGSRLLARVRVPPLGWTSVRAVEGRGELEHPVRAEPRALDNGLLRVEIAADGTLGLGALEGVGRIVAGGDAGDSYNYAPLPDDALAEEPVSVSVEATAGGPVLGELLVRRTYEWQARTTVVLTTAVELRAGEPFCRIRVSFDNPSRDHRVRFHIPLHEAAESSAAEGQFAVVERGLEAEGGHGEVPLPTFPASGFVDAGGVAALLAHVTEYELVEGRELALTLLRSIGLISRAAHPYREENAGPEVPIPDAQMIGPHEIAFAVYPHEGSWVEADVLQEAERYRHPFLTAAGTGGGELTEARGLEVDGAVLTALRRRDDWLELRLVRELPEAGTATVRGEFAEAREANLLGIPGAELDVRPGELVLELGAWEIRTVQFRGRT
jgi:Glycosyl hydrolases family 38 N-terminal domain/Alpha mannosidase middle domain/Glycosyl hydrolases family 38 C-terminal domain